MDSLGIYVSEYLQREYSDDWEVLFNSKEYVIEVSYIGQHQFDIAVDDDEGYMVVQNMDEPIKLEFLAELYDSISKCPY